MALLRHRPDDAERGSISAWAAVTTVAALLLVGICVDFGGQLQAVQEARSVAAEAARVGGQQLQAAPAIRGQGVVASQTDARAAASTYLAGSGINGTVSVVAGEIVVDTSTTYQTKFLSLIGITSLPASGHAEARIARAVEGVEQ